MRSELIASIVLYVIIIVIFLFALRGEYYDTTCADKDHIVCGSGKGRAYYNSRPVKGDSRETLIKKLVRTANYDMAAVHWRREMITAILVAVIAGFVIEGKLPNGKAIVVHTIIGFILGYIIVLQFQSSVVKPAMRQVDEIARLL